MKLKIIVNYKKFVPPLVNEGVLIFYDIFSNDYHSHSRKTKRSRFRKLGYSIII